MKAVLDASPIIAFFDELNDPASLLLTRELGYELLVPAAVCDDDITKEPSVTILANCFRDGSMSRLHTIQENVLDRFQRLHPGLGAGESEVILAVIRFRRAGQEATCVVDEGAARKIALSLRLRLIGTLGLITALRRGGLIEEAKETELKNRLKSSRFRIDERLLR